MGCLRDSNISPLYIIFCIWFLGISFSKAALTYTPEPGWTGKGPLPQGVKDQDLRSAP